jgi:hypothetical protein
MDQINEILLRLKIAECEAKLALREMERVALTREIDDQRTDPERRCQAILQRDQSIVKWGEIMTQLRDMREVQERETAALTQHSILN